MVNQYITEIQILNFTLKFRFDGFFDLLESFTLILSLFSPFIYIFKRPPMEHNTPITFLILCTGK
jgi:hypothetical protein